MGEQVSEAAVSAWWSAGAVAVVALLLLVALVVRRRLLVGGSGTVYCSLRAASATGWRAWRSGWGRYGTEELEWFPAFSLRLRPAVTLPRRRLEILGRKTPESPKLRRSTADPVVVDVAAAPDTGAPPHEATHSLAMSEAALTGFLSWLEAAPPGTRYHW